MDDEHKAIEDRLSVIEKRVTENNRMLRTLRNRARFATLITVLQWLIILGVIGYIWIFLQPYLASILKTYQDVQSAVDQVNSLGAGAKVDTSQISKLIEQLTQSLR